MRIEKEVVNMLNNYNSYNVNIVKSSDLFLDIGLDSLSFIKVVDDIEGKFNIDINSVDLAECLKVENLINLIKTKSKRD